MPDKKVPEKNSPTQTIPGRTNLVIAAAVLLGAIGLLLVASSLDLIWSVPLGIIFSFILLTNYALMHEATHDVLHANSKLNWLVGMVLSWLFPMSFTVFKVSHVVHHCCNRTDHEMFDCYYEGDFKLIKYIQWYGLLLGLWWPLIPIGNLLLAMHPGILRTKPFRNARSTAVVFDPYDLKLTWLLRFEILLGILFWFGLIYFLSIRWETLFLFYAFFAFNWSTRQYITHAFTIRDVKNGALNLSVSRPMSWILLQGQWDLVHHQHPHVSWVNLARLGERSKKPVSYFRQYLRLWKGPRLCNEAAPDILAKKDYQVMQ